MSDSLLEAFLAKIYVESEARAIFLADPSGEARKAGLNESQVAALEKIDRAGLELIAESLERKRRARKG